MKKMKNDNKGFTLVELIVVLVILAILAAILIPALLGYIDEAKNKQLEIHGKSVYTAAQAVASKNYAKNKAPKASTDGKISADANYVTDVKDLSEIATFGGSASATIYLSGDNDLKKLCTLKGIKYTENGITIYMVTGSSEWVDTEPADLSGLPTVDIS